MCEYSAQLSKQASPLALPGALRVLVVDDNVDAGQSLGMLLGVEGHEVLVCSHPHEALAAAPAFGPDVCILDIGLPAMSGHDLARALRAGGLTRAVFIAATGYGSEAARQASAAAGFALHLTKPVDPARLLEQLSLVRERTASVPPRATPQASGGSPMNPSARSVGVSL